MTVGAGAFSFANIKYSMDKSLETLLWGHGVTAKGKVFCHSVREGKKIQDSIKIFKVERCLWYFIIKLYLV